MEYAILCLLIVGAVIGAVSWVRYTTQPSKGCEGCDKDCPCKRF